MQNDIDISRPSREWVKGDRVLAMWSADSHYYPATIVSTSAKMVTVSFDDGDQATVPKVKVTQIDIDVGTRVYARWRAGAYYSPAVVERKDDERILIRYENGRLENTTISVVRVLKEIPWKVGDRILANWAPEPFFYPATVEGIEADLVSVRFDDGDQAKVPVARVLALDIRQGDIIFARRDDGPSYFPGQVTEKIRDDIQIEYEDGARQWTTLSKIRVLPQAPF